MEDGGRKKKKSYYRWSSVDYYERRRRRGWRGARCDSSAEGAVGGCGDVCLGWRKVRPITLPGPATSPIMTDATCWSLRTPPQRSTAHSLPLPTFSNSVPSIVLNHFGFPCFDPFAPHPCKHSVMQRDLTTSKFIIQGITYVVNFHLLICEKSKFTILSVVFCNFNFVLIISWIFTNLLAHVFAPYYCRFLCWRVRRTRSHSCYWEDGAFWSFCNRFANPINSLHWKLLSLSLSLCLNAFSDQKSETVTLSLLRFKNSQLSLASASCPRPPPSSSSPLPVPNSKLHSIRSALIPHHQSLFSLCYNYSLRSSLQDPIL